MSRHGIFDLEREHPRLMGALYVAVFVGSILASMVYPMGVA
jgi:hypothetical protein